MGLALPSVATEQRVVEVLADGAHATHVQGSRRASHVAQRRHLGLGSDGGEAAGHDVHRPERGVTLGKTPLEVIAPHLGRSLGYEQGWQPTVGELGCQLDILGAERCQQDRDVRSRRVGDDLERLAEAGALGLGKRKLVVLAIVGQLLFAGPDLAADLNDLAGAAERRVVGNTVPPLDDLRPRRTETEDATAATQHVDTDRCHGQQGRRPAVDRQDARRDLDPGGDGGQVAHHRWGVHAIGLGDPNQVDSRLFVFDDAFGHCLDVTGVVQGHAQLHETTLERDRDANCIRGTKSSILFSEVTGSESTRAM